MQMITVAVRGLDRLGELLPAVEALGRRHAGYHVRERDYGIRLRARWPGARSAT